MTIAKTLDEAIAALNPDPIEPGNPWYVQPTVHTASGKPLPPLAKLRAELLRSADTDRYFLSGHIGSGKSTELKRLLADPKILERFYVAAVKIDGTELPSLNSYQLLFLIAAELYRLAKNDIALTSFGKKEKWLGILQRMDTALYGASGLAVQGGKFGLEFDLFFLKLRQELSVDAARRIEFRKFAETQGTVLVDLIDALVDDISNALAAAHRPARVLVAIDDLEKLAHGEQLREIFDTNLGAFLAPRVPILAMLSPSITFGGTGSALANRVTHLRPIQVLKKGPGDRPMDNTDATGIDMLRRVLAARVDNGLFAQEVVDEAAVHSGGVMRDFFRLLRTSAILATDIYEEATVDAIAFHDVLVDETNKLAATLYPVDKNALDVIHQSHRINDPSQLDYMRRSVVLEYNHDGIWWEVTPMLWRWLSKP